MDIKHGYNQNCLVIHIVNKFSMTEQTNMPEIH